MNGVPVLSPARSFSGSTGPKQAHPVDLRAGWGGWTSKVNSRGGPDMVGPVGQRPLRCHSCTVTGDLWVPYMWGAKDLGMRARMKWNFILLLFKLMKLSFKK